MTAALKGLIGWPDLQVVLTKEPVDKNGNSLAPEGLDLKVVRYFPLAKVLAAFDAGVCATGYNGVHELLSAALPTVLVSNIRGMDDQEARAKWCHDFGYALRANQADLNNITKTVKKLQELSVRSALTNKCRTLPVPIGGEEIAHKLLKLAEEQNGKKNKFARKFLFLSLRYLAIGYRLIVKQKAGVGVGNEPTVFSTSTTASELHKYIRSGNRFEHLISNGSTKYQAARKVIADAYYN
jgi:hypothetical protein